MNERTIHAELKLDLLLDPRTRRDREAIAAQYEPGARELFAHREALLSGSAVRVTSRHRRGREEKKLRRAEAAIRGLRDFADMAHRAAASVGRLAEYVAALRTNA